MPGHLRPLLGRLLTPRANGSPAATGIGPRFALGAVILAMVAFRLFVGVGWDASIDESYHYLYTKHPDLSYFDHPPMTAWVAKAGILLCGGWVHPISLRLGFILTFALATWVLAKWTERSFGAWAGVYAAILLNVSGYYATIGGFAIPDVPSTLFTLLTMWALTSALVEQPGRLRPWVWVGLAFGGAMLSKYYAVFLPVSAFLYILVTPGTRRLLLTPGPYLAIAIGFAMFSPVILWNAAHEWASFRFQGGRSTAAGFKPTGFTMVAFGPLLMLLPWVWYLLARPLAERVRHFGSVAGTERLIVCLAAVPLGVFGFVSCFRWILMHWPVIGFLPLFPLAGAAWARWAAIHPRRSRIGIALMTGVIVSVAVVAIAQSRLGLVRISGRDPLLSLTGPAAGGGWGSVAAELKARGLLDRPNTFLFTSKWTDSAELAFAVREQRPVLCYDPNDARGFAFWSKPEQWVGWDGLMVIAGDHPHPWELEMVRPCFTRVTPLAEFPMTRGGVPCQTVRVWLCEKQHFPFPFSYRSPGR